MKKRIFSFLLLLIFIPTFTWAESNNDTHDVLKAVLVETQGDLSITLKNGKTLQYNIEDYNYSRRSFEKRDPDQVTVILNDVFSDEDQYQELLEPEERCRICSDKVITDITTQSNRLSNYRIKSISPDLLRPNQGATDEDSIGYSISTNVNGDLEIGIGGYVTGDFSEPAEMQKHFSITFEIDLN